MFASKRAQYVSRACAWKASRLLNKEHTNRSFSASSACFCKSEDSATECRGSSEVATRRETVLKGLAPVGLCLCPSCTKRRSAWYDKYFAYALSRFSSQYQELVVPYKQKLFNALQSDQPVDILEVGVGTGLNFEFYKSQAPRAHVVGLDPNPEMKGYAEDSAAESSLSNFEFVEGYAEQLPFEDRSFDYAVVTTVLCSVPDVEGALREIQRVLKPHGQFLFLEHVIGPPGSVTRLAQTVFNPVQQIIADGCHLTRDTLGKINSSSFKEVHAEEISIPEASFLAPHISGSAFV